MELLNEPNKSEAEHALSMRSSSMLKERRKVSFLRVFMDGFLRVLEKYSGILVNEISNL